MISKAMILGAAAAVVATGTGYYIATGGSSTCDNGCPIRAMFHSKPAPTQEVKSEDGGCCDLSKMSCCGGEASRNSKLVNAPKPHSVDSPTLAACVGGPAYATHPQPVTCCADE